jgi:hypothetical protein
LALILAYLFINIKKRRKKKRRGAVIIYDNNRRKRGVARSPAGPPKKKDAPRRGRPPPSSDVVNKELHGLQKSANRRPASLLCLRAATRQREDCERPVF